MKGKVAKRERETKPGLTLECFSSKSGAVAVWEAGCSGRGWSTTKAAQGRQHQRNNPFVQEQLEVWKIGRAHV